jgi:hypothetical protein
MPAPTGRIKPWKEMTGREILQTLFLFSIFGGVVASIGVWKLVVPQPTGSLLLPIILIVFSLSLVTTVYIGAIKELKRRKRK